jgi:hypothetical protein
MLCESGGVPEGRALPASWPNTSRVTPAAGATCGGAVKPACPVKARSPMSSVGPARSATTRV